MRRVFALLVMQYSTVLMLGASPFALIGTFQEAIHPHHNILEVIAVTGIVSSLVLAVTRGAIYPFARVSRAGVPYTVRRLGTRAELCERLLGTIWTHCGWSSDDQLC